MQMNRRFYLISWDKKFSNRFLVHFWINKKDFYNRKFNPTQFLVTYRLRKYG